MCVCVCVCVITVIIKEKSVPRLPLHLITLYCSFKHYANSVYAMWVTFLIRIYLALLLDSPGIVSFISLF